MLAGRPPKTLEDANRLLALSELLSSSVRTIIAEWEKESSAAQEGENNPDEDTSDGASQIPSKALHNAQRTVLGITGALTELVSEPSLRILELGCQYWESRALFIVAERRIPDILAKVSDEDGVSCSDIADATGIEQHKLSRFMRCLCSNHVFRETKDDWFANNVISKALVGNEPLRAYIMNFHLDLYATSELMPTAMLDPVFGPSYSVDQTSFQLALDTKKTRWEWLEEELVDDVPRYEGAGYPGLPGRKETKKGSAPKLPPLNGKGNENDATRKEIRKNPKPTHPRPEHAIFGLSMLGGGRVHGTCLPYDFPWAELGKATIVDVGGGVGGFAIQLSSIYPKLNFVIQDRKPVLEQAEKVVWPKERPQVLHEQRVTFVEHDFFNVNPVKDADIYWLRAILHDWSDDYCVKILSGIRQAITPGSKSRILICDQLMNTTLGTPEINRAPDSLPANYGYAVRFSHQRDLCMMGVINGIERTPAQLKNIVEQAGLAIVKVWECRSQVQLVELRAQ